MAWVLICTPPPTGSEMSVVMVLVLQCDGEERCRVDFQVGKSVSKYKYFPYCRKILGLCLESTVTEVSHQLLIGMPALVIKY